MSNIEDRIRKLEDRAEIQDLAARYFLASDDDDYVTLAACFTENARFTASGFNGGAGRGPIIEFLKAARAGMGQTVHTIDYAHVTLTGENTASGTVTAHLELGLGDTTYFAAVRYIDEYAREDGRWCIASREMKAVHVSPWTDVATSLTKPENVCWPGADPEASDFVRKYSS